MRVKETMRNDPFFPLVNIPKISRRENGAAARMCLENGPWSKICVMATLLLSGGRGQHKYVARNEVDAMSSPYT